MKNGKDEMIKESGRGGEEIQCLYESVRNLERVESLKSV